MKIKETKLKVIKNKDSKKLLKIFLNVFLNVIFTCLNGGENERQFLANRRSFRFFFSHDSSLTESVVSSTYTAAGTAKQQPSELFYSHPEGLKFAPDKCSTCCCSARLTGREAVNNLGLVFHPPPPYCHEWGGGQ